MIKGLFKSKIMVGLLSLTIILGGSIPIFASEVSNTNNVKSNENIIQPFAHEFVVTVDVLNVRSGPGTSYSIVGKLKEGDTVWLDPTAGDKYADGYWWTKIYKGSLNGWVANKYIVNIS